MGMGGLPDMYGLPEGVHITNAHVTSASYVILPCELTSSCYDEFI